MTNYFYRFITIILAVTILCGCQMGQAVPADFQISTITQPNSPLDLSAQNVSQFGEVAIRALNSQWGVVGLSRVQLWPGKVPEDWHVKLPLLSKTVIVGSLTAQESSGPKIQVFLDVAAPLDTVVDAYQTAITNQGYSEPPVYFSMSIRPSDSRSIFFCNKDTDLFIQVEKANGTLSRVVINQQILWFSVCNTSPETGLPPLPQRLPDPAGVVRRSSGNYTSGEGNQTFERSILTTLSLDELMAHYSVQLHEQGWTLADTGSSDYAVWSLWRFKDLRNRAWVGTVWISGNLISPTSKLLRIQVDAVPEQ